MDEKRLLLPSAKAAVLVLEPRRPYERYAYYVAVAIGLFCVAWGAADISARIASAAAGKDAAQTAFAPLGTLASAPAAGELIPARISIPALGVVAEVEQVGIKPDGAMQSPGSYKTVGWYAPGARPGGQGSAVFAGHVNNALSLGGVFEHLSKIKKGDYVTLADSSGKTLVYKVASAEEYPAHADTSALFATSGPAQIVLITCDGEWVPAQRTFSKRLVVIAKPAY